MPVASSPCDSIILEPRGGGGDMSHSFLCTRLEQRRWKVQLVPMEGRIGASDGDNTIFSSGLRLLYCNEIGRSAVRFLDTISKKIQGTRGRIHQQGNNDITSESSRSDAACAAAAAAAVVECGNSHSKAFQRALRELEGEHASYVVGFRGGAVDQTCRREFLEELDEVLSSAAVIGEDDYVCGEDDSIILEADLVLVTLRVDGQIEMQEGEGRDEVLFGIRV